MAKREIVWSPTALIHFQNWVLYIAKDSVRAAHKERADLIKAVKRLKGFPASGRIVPEFGNPNLREIIKRPIRIIYRLKQNEIRLLAFHHSRRELDRALFL